MIAKITKDEKKELFVGLITSLATCYSYNHYGDYFVAIICGIIGFEYIIFQGLYDIFSMII